VKLLTHADALREEIARLTQITNEDAWYRTKLQAENAKLKADNKALLDALKSIEVLCSQEITARFGGHAHKSEDELGRNSRVYALLVVPRNMARAAIEHSEPQ
jgi:hypothetical protein